MMQTRKPLLWGGVFLLLIVFGFYLTNRTTKKSTTGSEELASSQAQQDSGSPAKSKSKTLPQKKSEVAKSSGFEDLLTDESGPGKWEVKREDGIARVAFGGVVRNRAMKREDVDRFVDEFLEHAGIEHKQRQLSKQNTIQGTEENVLSYDQTIDRVPVYGAFVKVFVRKPDFGITYVINDFVNFSESRSQRSLGERDVEDRVVAALRGKNIKAMDCSREVYFVKEEIAYLSRVCQVDIDRPLRDIREVVVELGGGEVLKNTSLVIAN